MRESRSTLLRTIAAALALALTVPALAATTEPAKSDKPPPPTKGEVAKAEENRKKPLQRCDELKDKAQLDCLQKARERVIAAREKREARGEAKSGARAETKPEAKGEKK
jgi:hypothetical protein